MQNSCTHFRIFTTAGDHMIGHVYCKFTDEEDASDALQVMNDRYYDGRKMEVEFSPVQNFQEVRCHTNHTSKLNNNLAFNLLFLLPGSLSRLR